jgi:dTDP-4-amino-4,6-dideoxygalactose transaminase
MMVPLFSASAANANLDLLTPLKRVLDSAWYVLGREVTAFEQEFADYVGVAHCVSVANGTDALELALRAAGVEPGDLVVTVANAGFYSSTAIYAVGATPFTWISIAPA